MRTVDIVVGECGREIGRDREAGRGENIIEIDRGGDKEGLKDKMATA